MKKNKMSFETSFCAGFVAGNTSKAVETFFGFADLDYYKQNLSEVVMFCYKREIYKENDPSNVFVFYTAFSSFLKVCYCLQEKSKKWKVKEALCSEWVFHFSSLSKEEYDNPFLVFEKAFGEITFEDFELFLSQILELSLSPSAGDPDFDLTTPYIYLNKMLDATELIREKGVQKIRKTKQIDAVTE